MQSRNIVLKYIDLSVLNFETSILVSDEHPENIWDKSVTCDVSKLETSILFKDLQPLSFYLL